MLVFGTEMHIVTFLFLVFEVGMFFFQFIYYLSRPQEFSRLWYLILLFLLILYNVTGGLFPDKNISIPIIAQNIMAYGSGFFMAAYIPYYFYKAFKLEKLRFHALYGIYVFLILPFLLFFVVEYSILGDLELAKKHGIIVPTFYSIVLLIGILRATIQKYRERKFKLIEVIVVCCAIFPWACMPYLAYGNASQVMEVTVCNGGFLIITFIFIKQSIERSKQEYNKLQELNVSLTEKVKERTRQLEMLNEQRTNNFINLVHETKTPLTLVQNYLEEYVHKNGSGEELDIIRGSISKLTNDITSMFDLERFKMGFPFYNHNQVSNFSEILQESLALFKPYCLKQDISLYADIEESIFIKADPNGINRIINNLVENAIKFTNSGGTIKVLLLTVDDKVHFTVEDTGIGISLGHQSKIFEPYYQINQQTTSLQGMGLGLPIVKKVIESLGGEILIESNPQKKPGTRICITLDRFHLMPGHGIAKPSTKYAATYSVESFEVEDSPYVPNRQSILLVEDNKVMLHFLFKKLSPTYNLFCALNGAEALVKLHEIPVLPDLILSDIMMDKMDGFAFAKAISEQNAYNHIPIIFLSAKDAPITRLKGLRLGAIDYIQKPFSSDVLLLKIDSVLVNIKKQKRALLNSTISSLKTLTSQDDQFSPESAFQVFEQNCKVYNLTSREIEIVKLLRQGLQYKKIGEKLFISERTVTKHIQNVFEKVGVANKVELINKLEPSLSNGSMR